MSWKKPPVDGVATFDAKLKCDSPLGKQDIQDTFKWEKFANQVKLSGDQTRHAKHVRFCKTFYGR